MSKGNQKSTRSEPGSQKPVRKPKADVKPKTEKPKLAATPEKSKSKIEHSTSEIPKMEVHHHPQLDHNPKPWKEYLLEGFMIFIAVMMGFIAENIREDITNNEHVKQLTTQLMRDLKTDTMQLNGIRKFETGIVNNNDLLFKLLQQPLGKIDLKKMQQTIADSHSIFLFHPSMGAIGAIKNELHLKQLGNPRMIAFIADYERHIELLRTIQDITLQYQRNYLDPFLRLHFTPANFDSAFSDHPALTTEMRNLTQADVTQLAADMVLIRINTRELLRDSKYALDDAVRMLKYVKEHYNLED
ncbi:MAG TPA: hypothetical protein VFE54_11675 [Mucilaginibacter sp.]|jgi:hypothetical protein|nr:hypothetical protein [Mucilaginibacter sp.]